MALNYLLSPEFQISVTSGKPDTGGWIEVFLAGTRTKYFTACDFNGTKNPFRVNLDSLGQAVMLAEDSAAYDVFVYNRYGSLLFSRYNVTPSNGGGISMASITSEDGSITVTQTEAGVDLSVNGHEASVLRATAIPLTADGSFVFTRRQKTGESVDVGQQGNILAKTGWFHYDITAELVWNSSNANQVSTVTLSSNVNSASDAFDLSYPHSDFVQLSGEWKALEDNTVFSISVTGIPQGMTVKISDFGIHAINGGGSGSGGGGGATYTGVDGIIVDNDNAEIKPDFDVVQHKLIEGNNISISGNEISANVPTKTSELQNDSGFITSSDIPAIPTKTSELQNDSGFITAASVPTKTSELQNDSGFITSSALPTVNDATLTIQKNGTTVDTFTANSSTNKTVNIAVPTKTSDLQNDSGFITAASVPTKTSELQNDSGYITSSDIPAIPTKTSELQNDSGFITAASLPTVNDATLTIQKNGTTIDTFTANSSTNKTVNIAVPTKTSDLQNDSGFITSSDIPAQAQADWSETDMQDPSYIQNKPQFASVAMTGSYADLSNTPTIPVVDQTYDASSTNAQSGVAVAQALAGISVDEVPPVTSADDGKVLTADYYQGVGSYSWENPQNQVPNHTPSDYGKVLTVNSVGGLSWEAYGSSGSLDPGVLSLGNFIVRLRFGDTTYDPLSQAYASSFDSITRVSDGVYDFVFNTNRKNMRSVFRGAFTDITNNPVDILYIRGWNTDYTGPYMTNMFRECTGLRSIWNMNGLNAIKNPNDSLDYGNTALQSMFQDCTNLQEVHCFDVTGQGTGTIDVGRRCSAHSIFSGCTSLRIANVHIVGYGSYAADDGTSASMINGFNECKSLTVPPIITGIWSSLQGCFAYCESLVRFDLTPLRTEHPVQVYGGIGGEPSGLNAQGMFYGCHNLKSILPMYIAGPVSDMEQMFTYCPVLETAPVMKLAQGCNAYNAFGYCFAITETPELDYTKIQNAERMFNLCTNLKRIGQKVQGLATSATTVSNLFNNCVSVVDGTMDCYNALSQSSTIQDHTNTFSGTGAATDFYQGANIPTSWGGSAT